MRRRMVQILFWVFLLGFGVRAHADFRLSLGGGLGSTSTTNEFQKDEGPFVQSFTLEFLRHSRLILGVEHLRSLNMSPLATSISFTGAFFRYYLNAAPTPYVSSDNVLHNEIILRDISFFVGTGMGFAQSSLPVNEDNQTANAAGIYLSPRGGAEMSLTRHLGARGELMVATTLIGTGNITSVSLLGSLFYTF